MKVSKQLSMEAGSSRSKRQTQEAKYSLASIYGAIYRAVAMKNIIIPHGFQAHYTIGFANGLAANGIALTVIMSASEYPGLDDKIHRHTIKAENISSRWRIKKLFDHAVYHLRLIIYIARNIGSTVHITGTFRYQLFEGLVETILLRALSRRLILTVHNILPHDRHTRINRIQHWIMYRIPRHLIVHTERMKQELIRTFGVKSNNITVMEHGLNSVIEECPLSKENCRNTLGLPTDKQVLLVFGGLSPYKGIETMLDSLELLNDDYYLVIAGTTDNKHYVDKLKQRILENRNHSNILFINAFVPDDAVSSMFKASDVMVMPYKHIDQSGMVFLGMKMGLPIIAFDVGSLSDYIDKDIGIIVSRKDAEGLSQAITFFRDNFSFYSSDKIKKHAEQYEWPQVVRTVLDLYDNPKPVEAA